MFGTGPSGQGPRHNIFEGFQKSDEFDFYLKTLVDWQVSANKTEISKEKDVEELEHAMEKLIN